MLDRKWQSRRRYESKDDEIIVLKSKEKNYSFFYSYPIFIIIILTFLLTRNKQSTSEPGNVVAQARENGYTYEIHNVTTKDGYVLEIERIYKENSVSEKNKVVLLGHGMSQIGGAWLCKGPQKSLGYNLADDEYDVWLLNVRGNSISKHHTTISPSSKEYWGHTWHEMGIYDLPSTIDYILQTTKVQQLDYVGFSMGNTIYFVLLSEYPNYANTFRRVVALAPAVYGTDLSSAYPPFYYYLASFQKLSDITGTFMDEVIPGSRCTQGHFTWYLHCTLLDKFRYERYDLNINQWEASSMLKNSTGTFSSRLVHHYYQCFRTNEFRKYSYGKENNIKVYGSESPPKYNLHNVKPPMAIIYSGGDKTCLPWGIEKLHTELPNVRQIHKIMINGFSHASFHLADATKEEVNDRVIEFFQRNEV